MTTKEQIKQWMLDNAPEPDGRVIMMQVDTLAMGALDHFELPHEGNEWIYNMAANALMAAGQEKQ